MHPQSLPAHGLLERPVVEQEGEYKAEKGPAQRPQEGEKDVKFRDLDGHKPGEQHDDGSDNNVFQVRVSLWIRQIFVEIKVLDDVDSCEHLDRIAHDEGNCVHYPENRGEAGGRQVEGHQLVDVGAVGEVAQACLGEHNSGGDDSWDPEDS